ncbi:MAG: hypothetical protein RLZZ155_1005 [Bacteroidota bacterium]
MQKPKVLEITLVSKCGKLSRYNSSAHLGLGTLARLDERLCFRAILVPRVLRWNLRSRLFVGSRSENDWCHRRFGEYARCGVPRHFFGGSHRNVFPRKTHFEKHQRKWREMEQSVRCYIFIGEIFIGDQLALRDAACARR